LHIIDNKFCKLASLFFTKVGIESTAANSSEFAKDAEGSAQLKC